MTLPRVTSPERGGRPDPALLLLLLLAILTTAIGVALRNCSDRIWL